ncbi:MAG TPA: endonuclease/exonuclease/phosphatase family protein [Myxococcota bacterium]|nr:endonuclease/exonuclease/phosphatase family protein [Myxococcota bacterium]
MTRNPSEVAPDVQTPRALVEPRTTDLADGTTVRLVNLNTWIGCLPRRLIQAVSLEPEGHKERRYQALLAELRDRAPDLITLQECLPLPGFVKRLAEDLGYDLLWRVCNSGIRVGSIGLPTRVGRGEGLAILARREHRLEKVGVKRLSGFGLVTNWCAFQVGPVRWALAAVANVRGRKVLVVNTHIRYAFPSREAFMEGWATLHRRGVTRHETPPKWLSRMAKANQTDRDKELERLAEWTNRLREDHDASLLIGADFNLDPDAPQVDRFLAATGLVNALPALAPGALTWSPADNPNIGHSLTMTWPDGSPKSAVLQLMVLLDSIPQTPDHILLSPDLVIRGGGRAFDVPRAGALASDHFGVWVDAELA